MKHEPDLPPAESQDPLPSAVPAAALAFTPVELRVRADGWTPDRQRAFVDALADTGPGRARRAQAEQRRAERRRDSFFGFSGDSSGG